MNHILQENFSKQKVEKYIKEFKYNSPFPYVVIDNFLLEKTANQVLDNFKVNDNWTNYSLVNNYKKYGLTERKHLDKNCNEVFEELNSREFLDILTKITGINNIFLDPTLDGGGLHQVFNGGSLNIHTDFNSHTIEKTWKRTINILIYLNHNWLDEYEGNLELWDENGKKKIKSIPPIFNRCVIFKTDKKSFHGHPTKLNLPPDVSRKSIAAYYFVKEDDVLELYPTKFVARPQDSFYYKIQVNSENFLNKVFSFLKRKHILSDKFATKMLDLFK